MDENITDKNKSVEIKIELRAVPISCLPVFFFLLHVGANRWAWLSVVLCGCATLSVRGG